MGKVCICIDYGLVRCGLAVGDENDSYAMPLETVLTDDIIKFLKVFNSQQEIKLIVLGVPNNVSGKQTKMSEKIQAFQKLLELNHYSVILFDEGTSTRRAMAQMKVLGINSKKSKSKKDEAAAAIILQDYFDFMRRTRS